MTVSTSIAEGIAVIRFGHPPVNALSAAAGLPQALAREVAAMDADKAVRGIVLAGAGRCFSAGIDLADPTGDPVRAFAPVRALFEALDRVKTPLVMALHGTALGGGLGMALCGHMRVAAEGTRLGMTEVAFGLIPGAGGTQRLPRLIGMAAALPMIAEGRVIGAAEALRLGLLDQVVPEADLLDAARALAREGVVYRARDWAAEPADEALLARLRAEAGRRRDGRRAALAAIDCTAAASGDFAAGLRREYEAFDALLVSPESRGLRHAFLAERAVRHVPGIAPDLPRIPIRRVAAIGAGTMGTGIALSVLNADLPVVLIEPKPEALARSRAAIAKALDTAVARGRMDEATAAARLARLTPAADIAAAAEADLVIEAVFEDMAVKREMFATLDRVARPGAILTTNTSMLDVNAIAAATSRPQRVLGTHFFSPAHVMRLLEVVRGEATAPEVLVSVLDFAHRIGKVGVVAGVCDGFIGNRMLEEYLRQAYLLLEEGALPHEVDGALESWGMAMGPFRMIDMAGNDVGWRIRQRRAREQPDRPYSRIPDLVCERGRYGQKAGAGFYRYGEGGRKPERDPEIEALVEAHSAALGLARRKIGAAEIVERCILALVNEGAKLLAEGIAARPLDIDTVYLNGYGFPRERGGPMFHADTLGLPAVLAAIRRFQAGREGWAWAPAPLIEDLAARGIGFASLNGAAPPAAG